MQTKVLVLPGFGNSGSEHWQSLWERANPDFIRVQQRDWEHPVCDEWVGALEEALLREGTEVILVAYSMACLVVAHFASKPHHPSIKGAFIVAPPDVTCSSFPEVAKGFENTPLLPFDFPSMVVASTNDVYAGIEEAEKLAHAWGSTFVNIGAKGHINTLSGLGFWDEGWRLFQTFRDEIKAKGAHHEKHI